MPSLRPAHYIVIALSLIDSFKVFDLIYAMTYGGPGTATQVMGTWMYFNVFQYYRGRLRHCDRRGDHRRCDCRQHSLRPFPDQGACSMSSSAEVAPVATLPEPISPPRRS